jgi:branched-chain amino acid transport system ATP-binding protein
VLFVTDLTVHYGRVAALRRVSLQVLDGEVVGLIGPNGAGKTTLAHAVAGLVRPTSGRIAFNGTALTRSRPDRIARLGIALVPEGRHIFASLTVKENLLLGATPVRRRRDIAADVDEVLDLFPALRGFYGASAATLSGGEQQQLAIARALLARPRLLILDEPSLGLAPLIVDQIFTTLARLRGEGCTVLLIEQQALRTVRFADRAYVLRSGELVPGCEADDLLADVALAEVYLGRR